MLHQWLIIFFALCLCGSVLSLLLPQRLTPAIIAWIGAPAGVVLAGLGFMAMHHPGSFRLWTLAGYGLLTVDADRMSGLFLAVTGMVALPVAIFSWSYQQRYLDQYDLRPFGALYHLLMASIVLFLIAGDVFTFFIGWEAMSIIAYLLVNFEHRERRNTRAGLLMLAMGEIGTLAAVISMLFIAGGGTDFSALRLSAQQLGPTVGWVVFLLSFVGFGVKAGLVPINAWLPRAHPAAPANISALLSGVILNLGVYGILRVNFDLMPHASLPHGLVMVVVGSITAFIGILYAVTENDMKRMLAHSSIENMGIIIAGFGAAMVFKAMGAADLADIAAVAAAYHLVNHSLYKALLFLGAGSVHAASNTRDMNLLGGLIRVMPWTSLFFLAGALAISALPPMNGFVSEWLILQAFLGSAAIDSAMVRVIFVLCGALLALTAALAATCFVKAFAMSFLGRPRSPQARSCARAPRSMVLAMGMLALACLVLGITPTYVIPRLDEALKGRITNDATAVLVPPFFHPAQTNPGLTPAFVKEFHAIGAQVGKGTLPGRGLVVMHRGGERNPVVFAMSTSYTILVLLGLLGLLVGVKRLLPPALSTVTGRVWAGGMRDLEPGMGYTATGFSNPVRVVFNALFRPVRDETRQQSIARHFRTAITKERKEVHLSERWLIFPVVRRLTSAAKLLARIHSGHVNMYAAYLLMGMVLALLAQIVFGK